MNGEKRMLKIQSSAPSRVDLSGGAADLFGKCTLCCAISLRTYIELLPGGEIITILINDNPPSLNDVPLIEAVIQRAHARALNFTLNIHSDVPLSSGLGGSASLSVSLLHGLTIMQGKEMTLYELAEQAQRAETDLGMLNGYQDWYAAAFGGLLFLDFKGKMNDPITDEPYATVEDLNLYKNSLFFVVAHTRVPHDSSASNQQLYTLYKNGNKKVRSLINTLDTITRDAKKALIWNDIEVLSQIIKKNQEIIQQFGRSSPENEHLIKTAYQGGALACKVTGAGQGGCIAALCRGRKMQHSVSDALLEETDAVYPVSIDKGVTTETMEE
jgi:mevalonate kinase